MLISDRAFVLLKGTIDISEGRPFSNTREQKIRGIISVGSNTTIVGIGNDAKVINGNFMLEGASPVILRNGQRTPRVRYGQVHVYNNAYIASKAFKAYP